MIDHQGKHQGAQVFAKAFAESLAEALTQKVGHPWQLRVRDSPDLTERQGKAIHFRLTVDGALRGECFVELYEAAVAELGSMILGQAASAFNDVHTEALSEVITSALDGLRVALLAEYGAITLSVDRVEDLVFGGMFVVPLSASSGDQPDMPVMLYFDVRLLTALSPTLAKPATESSAIDSTNLNLVMDVELNVSLRFGQCKLPLREVLDLTSGSVIELDRDVDDPVELLLDGKVIARGEAVIVDGNYGLRVTEIPQPIASHFIR
ncbi:MAG TPA: flagellar motor switch protein FliN [Acidobacteriaceae bacterium]